METAITCNQSVDIATSGKNDAAALWLTILFERIFIEPKIKIDNKIMLLALLRVSLSIFSLLIIFLFTNIWYIINRMKIKIEVIILSSQTVPTEVSNTIKKVSEKDNPNSADKLYTSRMNNPLLEANRTITDRINIKNTLLAAPISFCIISLCLLGSIRMRL